jgi:hypothetical protein
MLADCCVLWCRECGAPWRPQDYSNHHDQSMCKYPCCRNCLLLLFFILFCRCRRHASFPNDAVAGMMWHNDQSGMEAATPMALMPKRMLIITSLESYCQLLGTKPYVFLHRSQPTTNPQCPSRCCDLNGQQQHLAPLQVPTQTTIAQNIGGLLYVAALGVGHHGGCGKMAAAKVGEAQFS